MEFKVNLLDFQELTEEDASLVYGYFSLSVKDFKISFFEERYCMIFLTLSTLLEFLSEPKKTVFEWDGVGNGSIVKVSVHAQREISFTKNDITIKLGKENFVKSIIKSTGFFIDYCLKLNGNIKNESMFKNLNLSYERLVNLSCE